MLSLPLGRAAVAPVSPSWSGECARYEEILDAASSALGSQTKLGVTEVKRQLRARGRGDLASRLGRLSKSRNSAAHLDVNLRAQVQQALCFDQLEDDASSVVGLDVAWWTVNDEHLWADHDFVLPADADAGAGHGVRAGVDLRADREFVLTAEGQELQEDRDIVLAAVDMEERVYTEAQLAKALDALASQALRTDHELVPVACAGGDAREHAAEECDTVLAAGANCETALEAATEKLRADRDYVLAASAKNGACLDIEDREIALAAVTRGDALENAAVDLDRESMLAADARGAVFAVVDMVVLAAHPEPRADEAEVAAEKLRADRRHIEAEAEDFRTDREIVPAAEARGVAEHAAEDMQADRENCNIMLAAVAAEHVRADRTVVLAAGEASIALEVAAENLRADREFVLAT